MIRHLLIYFDQYKKLSVFCGSYSAVLVRCSILHPSEYIILSPEGDIKDSHLNSISFLHQVFLYNGGCYNEG